ncbi:MAG: hypothetical protein IPH36_18245 [Saprospiraceae bacterium]|nr:hypothetical protein [Saprospiraceae bacterium]
MKKCFLRNNTFFQNGTIQNWTSEISIQNTDSCQIFQNILIPISDLHYAASIFGYTTTNMVFDNNLAYRYSGNQNDLIYTGSPVQFTATVHCCGQPTLASPFAPVRNFFTQCWLSGHQYRKVNLWFSLNIGCTGWL